MKKRILSLALALCMTLNMTGMSAFATETTPPELPTVTGENKECSCVLVPGASHAGHAIDCPLYIAEPVCSCTPVIGASHVEHLVGCPLYKAPPEVQALMDRIDALPNPTNITTATTPEQMAEYTAAFEEAIAMYTAIFESDGMTEEALELLVGKERMDKFKALRDILYGIVPLDIETPNGTLIETPLDFTATTPPLDCTKEPVGHHHADPGNYCFVWEPGDATSTPKRSNSLTLNGLRVKTQGIAVYVPSSIVIDKGPTIQQPLLKVTVKKDSYLESTGASADSSGWCAGLASYGGGLEINGPGKLTAKGGEVTGISRGIFSQGSLKINTDVAVDGGSGRGNQGTIYGVVVERDLTTVGYQLGGKTAPGKLTVSSGCTLTVKTGDGAINCIGVSASLVDVLGTMEVTNGSATELNYGVTCNDMETIIKDLVVNKEYPLIPSSNTVKVGENGKLTVKSGNSTNGTSIGIYAGQVDVVGKIDATSGSAKTLSGGVVSHDNGDHDDLKDTDQNVVTVQANGDLTATGGNGGASGEGAGSYGIKAEKIRVCDNSTAGTGGRIFARCGTTGASMQAISSIPTVHSGSYTDLWVNASMKPDGTDSVTYNKDSLGTYDTKHAYLKIKPQAGAETPISYDKSEYAFGDALPVLTAPVFSQPGTITYTASPAGVVTLDAATGKITALLKTGKVTITATNKVTGTAVNDTSGTVLTVKKGTPVIKDADFFMTANANTYIDISLENSKHYALLGDTLPTVTEKVDDYGIINWIKEVTKVTNSNGDISGWRVNFSIAAGAKPDQAATFSIKLPEVDGLNAAERISTVTIFDYKPNEDERKGLTVVAGSETSTVTYTYTPEGLNFTGKVKADNVPLTRGTDYTLAYYNENGDPVWPVNKVGTYNVVITPRGKYMMAYGKIGKTIDSPYKLVVTTREITPQITIAAGDYTYNNTQHKPTVTVKDGATELWSTDYNVTYGANKNAGAGAGSVTVTLKGNYTGTATKTFDIKPKSATVQIYTRYKDYGEADPEFTYFTNDLYTDDTVTGSLTRVAGETPGDYAITGELTNSNYDVTTKPGKLIISKADVDLSVSVNPTSVKQNGTAKVTVTAKSAIAAPIKDTALPIAPTLKAGTETVALTHKGDGVYEGTYTANTAGTVTFSASCAVNTNYNAPANETATLTVTPITQSPLTVENPTTTVTYNGSAQAFAGTVKAGSQTLTAGATTNGYTASYYDAKGTLVESPTNAGTYNVVIVPDTTTAVDYTPVGKTTGSDYTLVIQVKSITPAITVTGSYTYNNTQQKATVKVEDGSTVLKASDYDVAYGANVAAGTGSVRVTLKGNYSGYSPQSFVIAAAPVAIAVDAKSKKYGESDPKFTYTATPELYDGDTMEGSLTRTAGETPGTYEISGTLTNSNYKVTATTPAKLTIAKSDVELIVSVNPAIVVKGGTATVTVTAKNAIAAPIADAALPVAPTLTVVTENVALTHKGNGVYEATYTNTDKVGDIVFSAACAGDANYNAPSTKTTVLSVSDKTLVTITGVTAPANRVYTGKPVEDSDFGTPAFTPAIADVTPEYIYYKGSEKLAAAPKDAGSYTLVVKLPDSNATHIGRVEVPFAIGKATLTVTADNKDMYQYYDLPKATFTYDGFVPGENESVLTDNTLSAVHTAVNSQTAGRYSINITGGATAPNYELTTKDGTLIIIEKKLSPPATEVIEPSADTPTVGIPPASIPDGVDLSKIRLVVYKTLTQEDTDKVGDHIYGNSAFANSEVYEISLVDEAKNNAIVQPNGTITICIPYPAGSSIKDTFTLLHVKSDNSTETIIPEKIPEGLKFDVSSLSPFAIGWVKHEDKPVVRNSSDDGDDYEYQFWMTVKTKVNNSAKGDIVKVTAKGYDQMPASVMNAMLEMGVGTVISWNGGKTITIPAGKALKPETGRLFFPLSLLEQKFGGVELVNTGANPQNPETGGYGYLDTAAGSVTPVTGNVLEAPVAPGIADAVVFTADAPVVVTPPTAGMEPVATSTGSGMTFAVFAALAAMLAGGIWFYNRKYGTK